MRRFFTSFACISLLAAACGTAATAEPLRNRSIVLPEATESFPGGSRAEAINSNCLACHSTEMVLMQPALSRTTWAEEVAKMRKVFGAPVPAEDVPAIVDYLAALKPGD